MWWDRGLVAEVGDRAGCLDRRVGVDNRTAAERDSGQHKNESSPRVAKAAALYRERAQGGREIIQGLRVVYVRVDMNMPRSAHVQPTGEGQWSSVLDGSVCVDIT